MRLDLYLSERGLAASRSEAKRLISDGSVSLDGKVILKPAFDVSGFEEKIKVEHTNSFASRGGLKLDAALDYFKVDCDGRLCLDIGASSGGFTDCLLSRGARHVIAVDSGSGQLIQRLLSDIRVTSIENYNARYMKSDDFEYVPTLAVMDVSFISATYIIEPLSSVLASGSEFICLIKPQFEVGRGGVSKGGIVKDEKMRNLAVKKVVDFAAQNGFVNRGVIESPIKGGDGNIEFLACFERI